MAKKKTITNRETNQLSSPSLMKYAFFFVIFLSPLLRGLFFEQQFFLVAFILGVLCLIYFWEAQGIALDKLDLLMLALAGSYALSLIDAATLRGSYMGFIRYLLYFLCFYFIRNNIISDKDKKELANVYIAAISFMTMLTLLTKVKVLNIASVVIDNRLAGTIEYPNTYAVLLVAALVMLYTIYGSENTAGNKHVAWGSLLAYFNATALLATLSRGGFLIYLLMLTIIFIFSKARITLATNLIIVNSLAIISSIIILKFEGAVTLVVVLIGGILVIALQQLTMKVPRKVLGICTGISLMLATGTLAINFNKTPLSRLLEMDFTSLSFFSRYAFYRDAFKIFLDNWLIGTGSGGWELLYGRYQSFYYTSKLVHSSLVQSLVEVGLVGTSLYIAVVGFIVIKFVRLPEKAPIDKAFFIVFITIFLHSLIDFDLSIPAVPILMFIAMGAIVGPSNPDIKGKGTKIGLGFISVIMLLSVASMGIASFSTKAVLGNGTVDNLAAFKSTMSIATKLDPLNVDYHTYLGQAYLSEGMQKNNQIQIEEGLSHYNKAVSLEPRSYLTHITRGIALQKIGRFPEASVEYEQIIQIRPFHGTGYEYAMKNYLEQAVKNKDLSALNSVLQVYDRARQQMAKVSEVEKGYIPEKDRLNYIPTLNNYAGMACSLLGDFVKGYEYFNIAKQYAEGEVLELSDAWLVAVSKRLNREVNITAEADKIEEAQDLIKEFNK